MSLESFFVDKKTRKRKYFYKYIDFEEKSLENIIEEVCEVIREWHGIKGHYPDININFNIYDEVKAPGRIRQKLKNSLIPIVQSAHPLLITSWENFLKYLIKFL